MPLEETILAAQTTLTDETRPTNGRQIELDGPVRYHEIQARTILNRVRDKMYLNWTINPYRGCRHACVYCFARPTHTYYGLNAGPDFHSQIFVKVNAAKRRRVELNRPGWVGETICLGSVTDPYQPAERRYRLSRQILEVLCEMANPLDLITKSPLILDDLELLVELNRRTGGRVSVNLSLVTLDEGLARLIDPGAPAPHKRLDTLARLSAAGIKTRLFIMPVLPGITDSAAELEGLVRAGASAGVQTVAADPLRIARGLEDYYFSFIDRHFPALRPRYDRLYAHGRRTTVAPAYKEALRAKLVELREQYGLVEGAERAFQEPARLHTALERAEGSPPPRKRPSRAKPIQILPQRERQARLSLDN